MREIDTFFSVLEGFGIRAEPLNGWERVTVGLAAEVVLRRGRSSQLYTVLPPVSAKVALNALDRIDNPSDRLLGDRLLLTATRLNARTMDAYRERGIEYVDLAGNAFIRFGDVYIDVQGRALPAPLGMKEGHQASVNLFSARRAQVVFALLVWPELFNLPLRFTSEAAGVSMGIAFQTLQLLKESGYVLGEASPELVRKGELIDRWTESYATGLRSKLLLGRYHGDLSDVKGIGEGAPFLTSGEFAVPWLLRPTSLTVYSSELDPTLIVANRWRRDGQPNVEVRKKFWKDPRQILHEQRNSRYESYESEVPPLLVYADLMASGDGRQREAAKAFRKEHHELVDG